MNRQEIETVLTQLNNQGKLRKGSYDLLLKKVRTGYSPSLKTFQRMLPVLSKRKDKISWSSLQKEEKALDTYIVNAKKQHEKQVKINKKINNLYQLSERNREPVRFSVEKRALNDSTKQIRVDNDLSHIKDHQFLRQRLRLGLAEELARILKQKRSIKFKINIDTAVKYGKEDKVKDVIFSNKDPKILTHASQIPKLIEEAFDEIDSRFESYQVASIINNVGTNNFNISYVVYNPMRGSSYIPLPEWIKTKQACINVQNKDQKCFLWAIASALQPVKKNTERTNNYDISKFKIDGLDFPMKISQISKFEKMNNINVNVATVEGRELCRVHHSDTKYDQTVELLLIDEGEKSHYVWIKSLSRLITHKKHGKMYPCSRCLRIFWNADKLEEHKNMCQKFEVSTVQMPKKGEVYEFTNYARQQKVPFVIYADFEAILPKFKTVKGSSTKESYTVKTELHQASGFCFKTVCIHDKFNQPAVLYRGKNSARKFVSMIKAEMERIQELYTNDIGMKMTPEQTERHKKTKTCYICNGYFVETDDNLRKVRDHDHLTGDFRGSAHQSCNKKFRYPPFIPVVFHNLRGYDSHFVINSIKDEFKKISCIPNNEEKYISFSLDRLRFIDSIQFMNASLESLVENLKTTGVEQFKFMKEEYKDNTEFMLGKGIYCYEYVDSMIKFNQTEKPKKDDFYSSLYDSHITDDEYSRFCNVWEKMKIKNLGEYHDLYLMTDVLQLADVFESFRKVCLTYYQLDPCQYYTSPGLAWDAMLKMTGVKLEALNDVDMYLFCEMAKRGGVSTITKRYAKANNKYMGKEGYDKSKPNIFLMDWDANNLYGWAMSQFLPVDGFQWCSNPSIFTEEFIKNLRDDMGIGFFLMVDLEYPHKLHDIHNDYPLCPETLEIKETSQWSQGLAEKLNLHSAKVKKLVPNLNDKTSYVIHYRALKQCLEMGLKLKKVHKVLQFNQSPWLAKYVDFNTEKRKQAKNDFEKDFFKLMNNSVYGKTNENIRNRINFRLINDEKTLMKCVNKPTFKEHVIFNKHLVGVHQLKTKIMLNKPVYVGVAILDLSKVLMYDFHYGVIKKEFGNKATLLGTDTDSLKYSIECDDLYQWMYNNKHYFDLSDYPKDHFCYDTTNKKVLGKMKDEMNSEIMTEFIGLRAKMYAQKTNSEDKKKQIKKIAKGIKRSVIKKDVSFEDYKQALFAGANIYKKMKTFRSYNHVLYTIEMNKSGLCAYDDKRWILDNGVDTLAHGHYKIKNLK